MRRVSLTDLSEAARRLSAVPPAERSQRLEVWLDEAHAAHRYHKRLGRPHPAWGNGSLTSRIASEVACDGADMAEFYDCLAILAMRLGRRYRPVSVTCRLVSGPSGAIMGAQDQR